MENKNRPVASTEIPSFSNALAWAAICLWIVDAKLPYDPDRDVVDRWVPLARSLGIEAD